MSIKVRFSPLLRQLTHGQDSVEATGNNVGECVDSLEHQFPGIKKLLCDEQGQLLSAWDIYVNSYSSYPEELAKTVKDGDELAIVFSLGGG
jgi:molybdopterin converting factor small subunit